MGKYARMRLWYLKEHQSAQYTSLLFSGKLAEHLSEIEVSTQEMMETIVSRLKQERGITEELKATDQLRWVTEMESIRASAEECIQKNLIWK